MIPNAEQLLDRAAHGERLSSKERRHCISYNMAKQPDLTNVAMAELFKVTERMIRLDKKAIREERAKLVKEDDIGLVIADIAMSFDNQVTDIESSKKRCKIGSRDYLEHCKSIFNLQLQKVKALQELGYYPKSLGNMTVDKFEYIAVVTPDGSVSTRPVNLQVQSVQEPTGVMSAEFIEDEPKALPAPGVDS